MLGTLQLQHACGFEFEYLPKVQQMNKMMFKKIFHHDRSTDQMVSNKKSLQSFRRIPCELLPTMNLSRYRAGVSRTSHFAENVVGSSSFSRWSRDNIHFFSILFDTRLARMLVQVFPRWNMYGYVRKARKRPATYITRVLEKMLLMRSVVGEKALSTVLSVYPRGKSRDAVSPSGEMNFAEYTRLRVHSFIAGSKMPARRGKKADQTSGRVRAERDTREKKVGYES